MRKFLTLFFALAVTLSAFAFESGSFKYNVLEEPSSSNGNEGSVEVAGWIKPKTIDNPNSYSIIVPSGTSYQGKTYRVKRIGKKAFAYNVYVVHMNLSYGIEEICDSAFVQCNYMTTISLPSSVKKVGNWILRSCSNYHYCYMSHTTTAGLELAPNSFNSGSKRMLYLSYLADVNEFKNHSVLSQYFSEFHQQQSVCDFESNDFSYIVTKKETASSQAEVAIVDYDAANFEYDHSDGKLTINPADIKPYYFTRPFKITQIAPHTFENATLLKEFDFSKLTTVTKWGDRALANCKVLNTVKIASGTLGANMFAESNQLTTVELGAGVNDVSADAFNDASKLYYIKVDESNPNLSSYHNHLYNKDQTMLIRVPEGNGQYLNDLAHTVTTIYVNAYRNNPSLKSIRFEYGVKNILTQAFYGCSSLIEVALPSSVTNLGGAVFKGSYNINDVWINNPNPKIVTSSNLFENLSHIALHVPRGKVDDYKAAGWTGFKSYNTGEDAIVPHDYTVNTMGFTVTSTKPEKINDKQFDGRAKVVRSIWNKSITWGSATVPPSITIRNKEYAVTRIDDYAFNLDVEYELRNCENVDTVGSHAFGNQKVTSAELPFVSVIGESAFGTPYLKNVKWGNRLRKIGRYGFSAAPIENNIILPAGFIELGYRAFEQAKSKKLLIPSTLWTVDAQAFNKMNSLDTIIANSSVLFEKSFTFTDVPTSATVYVPVSCVPTAKSTSWKRFSNIVEGAYDFSYGDMFNTAYKMTVTSTEPFTRDGVKYAGKAKYVYNHLAHAVNSFRPDESEVDKSCGGERRYLMTEIGDSAFAGAQIKEFDFERMTGLKTIGRYAFYNGKLTSAVMPPNAIYISYKAFYGAKDLTEIVCPVLSTDYSIGGTPFGNNASDFLFYAPYYVVDKCIDILKYYDYSSTEKCSDRVAVCLTPKYSTFNLGVDIPLDFYGSGLDAYAVTGYDSSTGLLQTEQWSYTVNNDGGVIITNLTPNKLYKIDRMFTEGVSTNPGLLVTNNNAWLYLDRVSNAYFWDKENKKFVKPQRDYNKIYSGECYLELDNPASELYLDLFPPTSQGKKGDVNGDGTIDVSDVNLAINVMLGKDSKNQYPAADVNGDGTVDVTDVNLIINVMLGK